MNSNVFKKSLVPVLLLLFSMNSNPIIEYRTEILTTTPTPLRDNIGLLDEEIKLFFWIGILCIVGSWIGRILDLIFCDYTKFYQNVLTIVPALIVSVKTGNQYYTLLSSIPLILNL